jgi:hypothetical protein
MSAPTLEHWARSSYAALDDTAKIAGAVALTYGSNAFFKRYNTTTVTAFSYLLGARIGAELVGSSVSVLIDDKRGLDNWFKASNTMFRNRTPLRHVPILGSALTLAPNPLGVAEVLFDAGKQIGVATLPMATVGYNLLTDFAEGMIHRMKNPPTRFSNPLPFSTSRS